MESEFVVGGSDALHQVGGLRQRPGVDLLQLVARHQILLRIEIVKVPQAIPERVAQFAIGLGEARQNVGRDHHVFAEIDRRHPQAQDFRAVRFDDFVRVNHVAERLGHGAALRVEHPAVVSTVR